ncbi:hypothetical protein [Photobacterium leiognathi]|uniref:hypothetical protein n=1 Tax=Photobacterium leiognathi TaxID=553611 RepID=UPI002981E7D5|nr:hypothetical protein [Photobacterium leiognathi]
MNTHLKPISRWVAAGLIMIGAGTLTSQALASTTEAGVEIKNEAKVDYEDALGNTYQAFSNEAVVKVAQIYAATLKDDFDDTAAAGQIKYIVHELTNNGNGPEDFTLSYAQNLPAGDSRGPDDIDAASITMYWDENGTGRPDNGEAALASGSVVTIPAGQTYYYILAVEVPSSAAVGDKIGVTLTAQAHEGTGAPVANAVEDIGANNDGADDTNGDLITITNDAVINVNKTANEIKGGTESSTGIDVDGDPNTDLAVNIINYSIVASNTGNTAATDVHMFDGIPDGTTLIPTSLSSPGLIAADGDTVVAAAANLTDESALGFDLDQDGGGLENGGEAVIAGGLDLNHDGDTSDSVVPGVYAIDSSLPSGATVSMNFSVWYSPNLVEGGSSIDNQAFICANLNGGAGDTDYVDDNECGSPTKPGPIITNPTPITSENTYGGTITDTGSNGPGTSGGGDDDGTDDGVQTVDNASAGSDVFFYNLITNTGNSTDTFNLSIANGPTNPYPTGTTFKFLDATGAGPLVDTNSDNIADTGAISPSTCVAAGAPATTIDGITVACNQTLVRVVVSLPASASGGPFEATTTATSVNDSTQTDSKIERLTSVTPPTVDISNTPFTPATMAAATNVDPVDVSDGVLDADGTPADDIATVFNDPALGTTVTAPLYIANKGGGQDSFTLAAEGSYDAGSNAWLTALPDGWVVKFIDMGIDTTGDGNADILGTGQQIFSTAQIPPNSVQFINAEITIPSDPLKALADSQQASVIDANGDGDLDYIISIKVTSANSGATDRKVEAIDVQSAKAIAITPPTGQNQVEPGGSVIYNHVLTNTGNTTETDIKLTSVDDNGFTHVIKIDTTGDGSPDTALTALCPPSSPNISVEGSDGTVQTIELTCLADNTPMFELEPGETIPMEVTVFGPADAAPGSVNVTTITAESDSDSTLTTSAEDTTEIVRGQVRLYKYAAPDANCDGTNDTKFTQYFEGIEPQQCVIWMLVAWNQGQTPALNTVISDAVPENTTYETSQPLQDCRLTTDVAVSVAPTDAAYPIDTTQEADLGNLCYPTAATGADVTGAENGGSVTYNATTLAPGDKAVGIFTVKVD